MTRRFYRLLLHLYPKAFRERFGDEMVALAAAQRRRPWLLVRDAVSSLAAAHAGARRERVHRKPKRRGAIWSSTSKDVEVALRGWKRSPGFAAVAIGTIALGIGANTAIFSVVNGVVIEALPFADADRLVTLSSVYIDSGRRGRMSLLDVGDVAASARSIGSVASYWPRGVTLTGMGQPEVVRGAYVSDGLLATFGEVPVLGRDIREAENVPNGPRVVVIGHRFWQERYGGDTDVLGETITVDGESLAIVGVAPLGFDFPDRAELWRPAHQDVESCGRGCHNLLVVARLAPEATIETLDAELGALAASLADVYPDTNAGKSFGVTSLDEATVGTDVRRALFVLLGAVGVVLLIASANVAHLLLARASARTGEMAVRTALGASRFRIVRQLVVEAFVLAVVGGLGGVLLARWAIAALVAFAPENIPRLEAVALDGTVLAFACMAMLGSCFLFGVVPALSLSRATLSASRRAGDDSPVRSRSRSILLVGEVALSLVLLFAAALLLRSLFELRHQALGFDRDDVLTFTLYLPESRYSEPEKAVRFFDALEERLAALPDVEAVGSVFGSPMSETRMTGDVTFFDRPAPPPGEEEVASIRAVTPGYAETLRVPLVRGRFIEPRDRHGAPRVALVNESFAERFYRGRDPLGQRIRLHASFGYSESEPRTIVGIIGDLRSESVGEPASPEVWAPQAQMASTYVTVVVRGGVPDLPRAVDAEVRALDPELPLREVEMLSEAVERSFGAARFYSTLLAAFAILAVLLASVGLYGVVSYLVSQREREIGLRMALGASAPDVVRLVLARGLRPTLAGVGLGTLGALACSRWLQSMLYNVGAIDAVSLVGAGATLLAVAVVALMIPARRAGSLSPMATLGSD